jgi:hypothetical protein
MVFALKELFLMQTVLYKKYKMLLAVYRQILTIYPESIGNILRISILTFRKETTVKFSLFSLESSSFIVKTFSKSNIRDYRLETFEEIIKEGRKFNVFMTIASQRPSDISATIISQLHNYFLHRLINNNDLLAVEKTISYLDKVSADSIPNLATGTCILAGLMAKIPVVIKVNEIKEIQYQPQSHNINLTQGWK